MRIQIIPPNATLSNYLLTSTIFRCKGLLHIRRQADEAKPGTFLYITFLIMRKTEDMSCYASSAFLCFSFSSPNTLLLISKTASNPSLPLFAFCSNRSMLASSILLLIFLKPPHSAVISAYWFSCVLSCPNAEAVVSGLYTTVSRTLKMLFQVRFVEHIVTLFAVGDT